MTAPSWREVNRSVRKCRESGDPVKCLEALFREKQDGMVAFALGEEYEQRGMWLACLGWFQKAQALFPLAEWKERAKQAADRVKLRLAEGTAEGGLSEDALFVVSCTARKIWDEDADAPEYVPARQAYRGDDFRDWINDPLSEKVRWLILSARYGFIEADHPIANYDVTFNCSTTGPISDQTIINQVKYQSRWKDKKPLNSFTQVVVRGSTIYVEKVKIAFSPLRTSVLIWDDYEVGLGRVDERASRLKEHLVFLLKAPVLNFGDLQRANLPASPGLYAIYERDSPEVPLYVGKSENLARRIWDNHLKGNVESRVFRKKMGQKERILDEGLITDYILNRCQLRFLDLDEPLLSRLEHFAIGALDPLLNE